MSYNTMAINKNPKSKSYFVLGFFLYLRDTVWGIYEGLVYLESKIKLF